MNNKLAEALGIKFCKTCGTEIPDWVFKYRNNWESISHYPIGLDKDDFRYYEITCGENEHIAWQIIN